MWRADDPEGNESGKIKFELVRWTRGRGLDLGCGPSKPYPHFIGVDVREFGTPGSPNVLADSMDLSMFADGSMDFVYSSHLLEHLPDTKAALAHWWSKVKVGGYLILYLPDKRHYPNIGRPGANAEHKYDFLPGDIVASMREAASDWDCLENQERAKDREYSFFLVFEKLLQGSGRRMSCMRIRPAKTAAVVRYGAYGDALWASSVLPHLKAEGYHVTVYTEEKGEELLKTDPNVDEIVIQSDYQIPNNELLLFWLWECQKYDRWINLVGGVESRLLPQPADREFYWPDNLRREMMNENYLETVHRWAGVPQVYHQKFYPTDEERAWAEEERAKCGDGPVVVIAPSGSSAPKFWPYSGELAHALIEHGATTYILGDLRGQQIVIPSDQVKVIGTSWPIRRALAFAQQADIVVGTESVVVNAVAFEETLKIVLLSHSTAENLTKHWKKTVAMTPKGLPCYPCHRVHTIWHFCTRDEKKNLAMCQAGARPEIVLEVIVEYLRQREGKVA